MALEDGRLSIPFPEEGEILEEYLQRYTEQKLQRVLRHPQKSIEFCSILLKSFNSELSVEIQNLWDRIKLLNTYKLLQCIEKLKPVRERLLNSLAENANNIETYVKYCSYLRLLGNTVDVAGTIGGLWMKDSHPQYSGLAFTASTAAGYLSFTSTISEAMLLKKTYEDLMELIQTDDKLLQPIKCWWMETEDLKKAMQDVFQFDITSDIVKEFAEKGESEFSAVKLLSVLLRSVLEMDAKRLKQEKLIKNIIRFTSCLDSKDLYEWLILLRQPLMFDIIKMVLQLQFSPLKFLFGQYIPALPASEQNFWSIPVWGRIGLNAMSAMVTIKSLRSSEISTLAKEMRDLRKNLLFQKALLQTMTEFVKSRRKQE